MILSAADWYISKIVGKSIYTGLANAFYYIMLIGISGNLYNLNVSMVSWTKYSNFFLKVKQEKDLI